MNSSASEAAFQSTCESVLSKIVRLNQSTVDEILSYDKPDSADIVLPDGRKFFWYLAIGSMMNPISLYLRDLTPVLSYPARCPNYKLVFRGMADVEYCPDSEFHGVVHLLSDEQMARLDKLEMGYNRIVVNVIDYQNNSHSVHVYQMKLNNTIYNLPSERYLDIIIKGGEHYRVQSEYLQQLKEQQDVIPRKQPSTFQSFADIPTDIFFTEEELAKHNGNDGSPSVWISINGKILEYTELLPNDHPDAEHKKLMFNYIKTHFAGREIAPQMAKNLYEPLYELPINGKDLCEQQKAQIEDEVYCRLIDQSTKNCWKPVGRLHNSIRN